LGETYGLEFLDVDARVVFASTVKVTKEPTIPENSADVSMKGCYIRLNPPKRPPFSVANFSLLYLFSYTFRLRTYSFLTSLFVRGLRATYCPPLRQFAAVRRIVEQRCLLLCQSNFSPLFVFIEIAGCTFILGAEGKKLGARSQNLYHLAPVADFGLLALGVGPDVLRLTLFAVPLFS